jgi:hypothetical protein
MPSAIRYPRSQCIVVQPAPIIVIRAKALIDIPEVREKCAKHALLAVGSWKKQSASGRHVAQALCQYYESESKG